MAPFVRGSVVLAMLALLAIPGGVTAQTAAYSIKTATSAPPKEIGAAIAKLLVPESVRLMDKQGKQVAEVWFRKEVPADATPEQIKNGVTYKELKQTEIIGAVRFDHDWTDYRKQKVKAGVYTLRLGFQPADGDHAGSSKFTEFLVALDAAKDTKADLMEPKEMIEASQKSINTGHPGVFMLFPVAKPPTQPKLIHEDLSGIHHWVVNVREGITVGGKQVGAVGVGLTLVGNAP
jgi:hypothetical protein